MKCAQLICWVMLRSLWSRWSECACLCETGNRNGLASKALPTTLARAIPCGAGGLGSTKRPITSFGRWDLRTPTRAPKIHGELLNFGLGSPGARSPGTLDLPLSCEPKPVFAYDPLSHHNRD